MDDFIFRIHNILQDIRFDEQSQSIIFDLASRQANLLTILTISNEKPFNIKYINDKDTVYVEEYYELTKY